MLQLPEKAKYNRTIPKKKLYEQTGANEKLKRLFIEQIESIYWQYKLSKESTNLSSTKQVSEIQVFEITQREPELSEKILKKIDTEIPYPILYSLKYGEKYKLKIAYKEKSKKNPRQYKVLSYHETDWKTKEELANFRILNGINLKQVYEHLIKTLSSVHYIEEEPVTDTVKREQERKQLEKKIEKLEKKIKKEKQFNRKVEMNLELKKLTKKRQEL